MKLILKSVAFFLVMVAAFAVGTIGAAAAQFASAYIHTLGVEISALDVGVPAGVKRFFGGGFERVNDKPLVSAVRAGLSSRLVKNYSLGLEVTPGNLRVFEEYSKNDRIISDVSFDENIYVSSKGVKTVGYSIKVKPFFGPAVSRHTADRLGEISEARIMWNVLATCAELKIQCIAFK